MRRRSEETRLLLGMAGVLLLTLVIFMLELTARNSGAGGP